MNWPMAVITKDFSSIISSKEKVFKLGLMERHMTVIMKMGKEVDMEYMRHQMDKNMKDNGKKAKNMEKVNFPKMMAKQEKEYGIWEKGLNGLRNNDKKIYFSIIFLK